MGSAYGEGGARCEPTCEADQGVCGAEAVGATTPLYVGVGGTGRAAVVGVGGVVDGRWLSWGLLESGPEREDGIQRWLRSQRETEPRVSPRATSWGVVGSMRAVWLVAEGVVGE